MHWHRGYWVIHPDRARQRIAKALSRADEIGHIGSKAHAMDQSLMLSKYRNCPTSVLEQGAAMIDFADRQRLPDYRAKGDFFTGWAHGKLKSAGEGIRMMRHGIDTFMEIGTREDFPVYFEMLAEVYGMNGEPQPGLEILDEAFDEAEKSGLHYWDAELFRRRGELLRMPPDAEPGQAERCFRRALDIAREQSTLSLELRAAESLARLCIDRDEKHKALNALDPVYKKFTEGFSSRDLTEAGALIRTLS